MLSVARTLAENRAEPSAAIEFVEADAQTHAIQPDSFDAVFSRFGVMFFEDPVAAFSNIRTALRPNGRLGFCCWQPRAVNPFMTVPAMAALELLPAPPQMPPRTPGPFAFEEPEYVERILTQSGFNGISVAPLSHPLVFGRGLALADIVERLVQIGPIAQMVREAPGDLQQPVRDKVTAAVSAYYTEDVRHDARGTLLARDRHSVTAPTAALDTEHRGPHRSRLPALLHRRETSACLVPVLPCVAASVRAGSDLMA